jgi:hypothetical protein
VQGGFARFFYSLGYRSADAIVNYVSTRLSDIVGVQRGGTAKADTSAQASQYSPRYRAKKVVDDLKAQVMDLCAGNIVEFNTLMASDVSTYLLKFELFIKQQKNGISKG